MVGGQESTQGFKDKLTETVIIYTILFSATCCPNHPVGPITLKTGLIRKLAMIQWL